MQKKMNCPIINSFNMSGSDFKSATDSHKNYYINQNDNTCNNVMSVSEFCCSFAIYIWVFCILYTCFQRSFNRYLPNEIDPQLGKYWMKNKYEYAYIAIATALISMSCVFVNCNVNSVDILHLGFSQLYFEIAIAFLQLRWLTPFLMLIVYTVSIILQLLARIVMMQIVHASSPVLWLLYTMSSFDILYFTYNNCIDLLKCMAKYDNNEQSDSSTECESDTHEEIHDVTTSDTSVTSDDTNINEYADNCTDELSSELHKAQADELPDELHKEPADSM